MVKTLSWARKLLLGCVAIILATDANGYWPQLPGSFAVEGADVVVEGSIDERRAAIIIGMIENHALGIRRVVFSRCAGGTVKAGLQLALAIRENKLSTVARSAVASSCAVAFLAGVQRSVDWEQGAAIAFHNLMGPGRLSVQERNIIPAAIDFYLGRPMPEPIRTYIRDTVGDDSAVIFYASKPGSGEPAIFTVFCNGAQQIKLSSCPRLQNADIFDLNIITEGGEKVGIPPKSRN
jgi:hypothetical protein